MRTINIHVLAIDAPATYFYLYFMRAAGLQPKSITFLKMTSHNPKVSFVEKILGSALTYYFINKRRWRGYDNPELRELFRLLKPFDGNWPDFFKPIRLEKYCNNIKHVYFKGWRDLGLLEYIQGQSSNCFLYTGGGLVPKDVLELKDKHFIHIHPGVLPEIRGADCFLWSLIMRGKPGATCFYMDPGIDTGRIIATKDFELEKFDFDITRFSLDNLYNAVRFFYDYSLRAKLLVKVLESTTAKDLTSLNAVEQKNVDGENFYFMHPELRKKVIKNFLCVSNEK